MVIVIGLDVGGTKIEGIIARADSVSRLPSVLKRVRLPTEAHSSAKKVIRNIASVVSILDSFGRHKISGYRLSGIGLGCSGFLRNGKLEMCPNIPALRKVRLRQLLASELRKIGITCPLKIENDSICFALAESTFGAGRGRKNVIGLIVGTGIGCGLVLDGRLCRGRDGGAGHFGHTVIDPSGPKCACGQAGHFEAWCSGKQIELRYKRLGGKIKGADASAIYHAARKGNDAVARKLMKETFDKFGIGLANLVNMFNPNVIVLGGGLSNLPESFYSGIRTSARKRAYPAFFSGVKIVKNRLGDSAGVFGAVALLLKNTAHSSKMSMSS